MAWWDAAPLAPSAQATPAPGAKWWEAAPVAPEQHEQLPKNDSHETASATAAPSMVKDVGMTLAGLPQEALAREVGLPGDILETVRAVGSYPDRFSPVADMADRAGSWLAEKVTGKPAAGGPVQPQKMLPTTADIKRGVDSATGMKGFYTPKTMPGRVTQEALAGYATGRPFGRMAGWSSGLAGTGGQLGREVFKDTPLEGPAGLVGALAGGGIPSLTRSIGAIARPGDILAKALENTTPEEFDRAVAVQNMGLEMGVPLTGPEAIQQAQGLQTRLGTLQRAVEQAPTGEASMRPFMAQRPAQIEQAGRGLLRDTFGEVGTPEAAATGAQKAAENIINRATTARTEATSPAFTAARAQKVPVQGLDVLKADVKAKIAQAGTSTKLGRALRDFEAKLSQVEPDPVTGAVDLGPLTTANREVADMLSRKYNPMAGPDQPAYEKAIGAEVGPLNAQLTKLLGEASPDYRRGLDTYADISQKNVAPLFEGPVGRLAEGGNGLPDTRLSSMADEFLDPNLARPEGIKNLAGRLAEVDPRAVPHLVGARMENIFNAAIKDNMPGANAWGGAKFVTEVMGNPQAKANLRATIEAIPGGKSAWPGWVKFAEVMQATGKRLPRGSDTAMNLGMAEEMKGATGALQKGAASPLAFAQNALENFAYRANARELGRIFTQPDAVQKMREMALLNPASRKAQLLAAEILAISRQAQQPTSEEQK